MKQGMFVVYMKTLQQSDLIILAFFLALRTSLFFDCLSVATSCSISMECLLKSGIPIRTASTKAIYCNKMQYQWINDIYINIIYILCLERYKYNVLPNNYLLKYKFLFGEASNIKAGCWELIIGGVEGEKKLKAGGQADKYC